jgi:putative tricarboxylic transport membrane protein
MFFYALAMKPLGFLLATASTLAAISYLVGNRSALQIGLVSIMSPILLYLVATRLLAVSLPELSVIEFAYSRLLGE